MLSKSKLRRPQAPFFADFYASMGGLVPAQNHFTGLAGAHRVKTFLEVINAEAVGDDR